MTPVLKTMADLGWIFIKPLWPISWAKVHGFCFLFENRFGMYEDDAVRFLVGFSKISRTSFIFHISISIVPNGINPKQPPGMYKTCKSWDLLPTSTGEFTGFRTNHEQEVQWFFSAATRVDWRFKPVLRISFSPQAPKAMFGHSKPSKKLAVDEPSWQLMVLKHHFQGLSQIWCDHASSTDQWSHDKLRGMRIWKPTKRTIETWHVEFGFSSVHHGAFALSPGVPGHSFLGLKSDKA